MVTGLLGEVMRESAQAALTYIRTNAEEFGIDPGTFRRCDVHIHFPEGATPKDGPSAGVAIATCLASLFTGRPVRHDLAMTGEITLKGRVLEMDGSITLSENPTIEFDFPAGGADKLDVTMKDSDGAEWRHEFNVGPAS